MGVRSPEEDPIYMLQSSAARELHTIRHIPELPTGNLVQGLPAALLSRSEVGPFFCF